MFIDYPNRKELETICVHDALFWGFEYLYNERQIRFKCTESFDGDNFSFVFNNVIYFNVQSCYFWGAGPHILWLSIVDDKSRIEELLAEKKHDWLGLLNEESTFIQLEFQLNSGDTIFIICESVDVNKF